MIIHFDGGGLHSENLAEKGQTTNNSGPMTEIKFWDEKVDTGS